MDEHDGDDQQSRENDPDDSADNCQRQPAKTVLYGGPFDGLVIDRELIGVSVTEIIFRDGEWYPDQPHDSVYRLDTSLSLGRLCLAYKYGGESIVVASLRDMKKQRDQQAAIAYDQYARARGHWETVLSLRAKLREAKAALTAAKKEAKRSKAQDKNKKTSKSEGG